MLHVILVLLTMLIYNFAKQPNVKELDANQKYVEELDAEELEEQVIQNTIG